MKNFLIVIIFCTQIIIFNGAYSQVKEYYITCDPADLEMIYDKWQEDIYIPITITHQGKTWSDAKMRIKGDGTREFPKKSFKVQFEGTPFINGRHTINLNAEYENPDYMTQYLCTRIFAESGHECFTSEHARLYINGRYWGLYLRVENIDSQFLEARDLDASGNLYKASYSGSYMGIYDLGNKAWEKKTNESEDWSDLERLIDELNRIPQEKYLEWARKTFDYNRMINIIAVNMLIANKSTYYHNYYMFNDKNRSGKWMMFPWDLDKTLHVAGVDLEYNNSSGYYDFDNPFLERAIMDSTIFSDIKKRVKELAETVFNEIFLYPIIDSLVNVLIPSIIEDSSDNMADTTKLFRNINLLKNFIKQRYSKLKYQFDNYPYTFIVERTPSKYYGKIKLTWHAARDPNGDNISYRIRYSNKRYIPNDSNSITIDNITDTTYTLENLDGMDSLLQGNVKEVTYWWKVSAYDGKHYVDGWDKANQLIIAKPAILPCEIDKDTTLTRDYTPYKVECDLRVNPGVTLKINDDVQVLIDKSNLIRVYGSLIINGKKGMPVTIGTEYADKDNFASILLMPGSNVNFNYCNIEDVYIGGDSSVIAANNTTISRKKITRQKQMIYLNKGNISISDCNFIGNGTGAGIYVEKALFNINKCYLFNIPDAVKLVEPVSGMVQSCTIIDSPSDAIDIDGGTNIIIENNFINGSLDKGISIGNMVNGVPATNIHLIRNIIINCGFGIAVKDSSYSEIINNTLYNNDIGIALYQTVKDFSGGIADIVNTIISNSKSIVIRKDNVSKVNIRYSLCDNEQLSGEGNIFATPLFVNPTAGDFQLEPTSPCINAGDPNSTFDPDGTRADIGAIYFNSKPKNIVINEINYNSLPDFDSEDWVEFYNPNADAIGLRGWYFKDSDDNHRYSFPENIIIEPDDFIVLCKDTALFKKKFPSVKNYTGNMGFGLDGAGELIRLYDFSGNLIDSVRYDDVSPWPTEPDGMGATLELINPTYDNALAQSWKASIGNGSPGAKNSVYTFYEHDESSNDVLYVYPNPTNESIFVRLLNNSEYFDYISITDLLGHEQVIELQTHKKNFAPIKLDKFSSGIYIVNIRTDKNYYKVKIAVLK